MLKLLSVLVAIICLLVAWVLIANCQTVSLHLSSAQISIPLGGLLLIAFVLGTFSTSPLLLKKISQQNLGNRKLQEWEIQDAKLAAQVKSEREKQLEAKINTLETALKTALKKNS